MGLLTAHTANKLKSGISPATRVRGLTDISDGLASRHGIVKVTADRVSEAKAYSDYIENSEFEIMKVFIYAYMTQMSSNDEWKNHPITSKLPGYGDRN